ncbi:phosphatidate cytidylyltransferase [Wenxinia marina]|uniref:Phosphatidate cytidylyltransferase n=1 Tax=Wenxinia marina DSM 24838 TaxID=1123501 RepID=A0A0D0PZG1_9RHOB|nr:phosphatidate cytidylyltransferase [Wenxinia marina]KIQ67724.1 CDP-diglyceride synthetase [Wenxinia marina DSM 24838]GGL77673.1 phosphatidate cytidylyltransferase [Wenxinia marina]
MTAAPDPGRWSDLSPRLISGAILGAVGLAAIVMGGAWFQMLAVFAAAVMVWELWMMIEPGRPTSGMLMAALVASVMSGMMTFDDPSALLFFLVAPVIGTIAIRRERLTFFVFALGIQIAGWGLVMFRDGFGFTWLVWMVLIIMVTDVFGYFAGRTFGGPKFWPRVSPKKTWSGTVAGWVAAAIVGALFDWYYVRTGPAIIPLSVLLSFSGQMGDIAESALKRRMGVKDSSTLIPGHGGLFDRFDALLGASLFLLFVTALIDVPGVSF